ncbi:MAG: enolase C-terminal domain-like protein [Arachidicoccus sp.]|nr:enolase C-terminal domain-like protein [Arachidicoccus sp.]
MQEKPWPIYKIKLGTDRDIEIVESLRKHTNATLRIDANAAWTTDEALEKIKVFSQLGVEFIEQPLAKDDWAGMEKLFAESPLPLYADESCVFENDVEKCVNHFHGINIKLTKCSGISPALRMIQNARKLDLKIMLGSMNESTIGSSAIAHLLPLVDHVDMDGPLLLKTQGIEGLNISEGNVCIAGKTGLGISFY